MKTIIVRVQPFTSTEDQRKIEEELRYNINRQRGTGVIVLPNYATYEGEIHERNCENCEIAQNYNLEDDDTPCLNCDEVTL